MTLPEEFLQNMRALLPDGEFDAFISALSDDQQPTSIRINPRKSAHLNLDGLVRVPWCENGYYLPERPQFTLDPLFHAGCYYVQEASSMFVSHVVKFLISEPIHCLDLCAAPGGKSTAILDVLPEGSDLISNEIDRRRARILAENITKWGHSNVTVTSNSSKDFMKLREVFDLIICDVPCSGEGMFRKDDGAITDWSMQKVTGCVDLQHEILHDIWGCLKPGGFLVYSTCTFNTMEDEEMIDYICNELGGTTVEIAVEQSWNIHPPLIGKNYCYRFMPHYTKGEGLFMSVVRKSGCRKPNSLTLKKLKLPEKIFVLQSGIEKPIVKGKDLIPSHAQAMSFEPTDSASFPRCEVSLEVALDYLRRIAIVLPEETPRGYVLITYKQQPLGFVKNLGTRSNNLYPMEWRIRNC